MLGDAAANKPEQRAKRHQHAIQVRRVEKWHVTAGAGVQEGDSSIDDLIERLGLLPPPLG